MGHLTAFTVLILQDVVDNQEKAYVCSILVYKMQ